VRTAPDQWPTPSDETAGVFHVAGVDLPVCYRPSSGARGSGGDWYDIFPPNDGGLVVVIGDVAGHGNGAVAAAAAMRTIIRGQLRKRAPLHGVFATVTAIVGDRAPYFATAVMLHVDRPRWRLGYLSAGHPCALVRRPGGTVDSLDAVQHPPIGVPYEAGPLTYDRIEPGTLVLAYTDGLVERRERSIVDRIGLLAKTFAEIEPTADLNDALRVIVDVARRPDEDGEPLDDDVAAILIRT